MSYEETICDANVLYAAYKASIKGSKWKESTQRFMINFLPYLFSISDDLRNRTLKNGTPQEFILHERGRVRPITSIPIRDRIVRHAFIDSLVLPEVKKKIIYDNCASIEGRGISQQRKRFEIHLKRYYKQYGNEGYILFGDFSKFYDNVIHSIAKDDFLKLFNNDEFVSYLLDLIFEGFKIDVSYLSDEEYEHCLGDLFNKTDYQAIPKSQLTGKKWMEKSINIGDQLSQVIGVYYPTPIDTYVKTVRSQKFYGRYMDDFYIMSSSKDELIDILQGIICAAANLGIHINKKKTHIQKISKTFTYLQIRYTLLKNGKIIKRLHPVRVKAMHKKLRKLSQKVTKGEVPYEYVESMFKSWMGSFYKLLPKTKRKNMIELFETSFDKKIEIQNKKLCIIDI